MSLRNKNLILYNRNRFGVFVFETYVCASKNFINYWVITPFHGNEDEFSEYVYNFAFGLIQFPRTQFF